MDVPGFPERAAVGQVTVRAELAGFRRSPAVDLQPVAAQQADSAASRSDEESDGRLRAAAETASPGRRIDIRARNVTNSARQASASSPVRMDETRAAGSPPGLSGLDVDRGGGRRLQIQTEIDSHGPERPWARPAAAQGLRASGVRPRGSGARGSGVRNSWINRIPESRILISEFSSLNVESPHSTARSSILRQPFSAAGSVRRDRGRRGDAGDDRQVADCAASRRRSSRPKRGIARARRIRSRSATSARQVPGRVGPVRIEPALARANNDLALAHWPPLDDAPVTPPHGHEP